MTDAYVSDEIPEEEAKKRCSQNPTDAPSLYGLFQSALFDENPTHPDASKAMVVLNFLQVPPKLEKVDCVLH